MGRARRDLSHVCPACENVTVQYAPTEGTFRTEGMRLLVAVCLPASRDDDARVCVRGCGGTSYFVAGPSCGALSWYVVRMLRTVCMVHSGAYHTYHAYATCCE